MKIGQGNSEAATSTTMTISMVLKSGN